MSVTCEKCGADISFEGEDHPNCATVVALSSALFEVIDAVCGLDRPWYLVGYGIDSKRAEEICGLAELGRRVSR